MYSFPHPFPAPRLSVSNLFRLATTYYIHTRRRVVRILAAWLSLSLVARRISYARSFFTASVPPAAPSSPLLLLLFPKGYNTA